MYFTIRNPVPEQIDGHPVVGVNYDSLTDDLEVGCLQDGGWGSWDRSGWVGGWVCRAGYMVVSGVRAEALCV